MPHPISHQITVDCGICGKIVESASRCPVCKKAICDYCERNSSEVRRCNACQEPTCREHLNSKGICYKCEYEMLREELIEAMYRLDYSLSEESNLSGEHNLVFTNNGHEIEISYAEKEDE